MTKSALWRRLDTPGHDAARVSRTADGWRLEGTAVFGHELGPARIQYWVDCAPDWTTRRARVTGWVGDRRCDVDVSRSEAGEWQRNGEAVGGLEQCLDVDFGFTPATNYLQLHRAGLKVGDAAEFPVAWMDVPDSTLVALPQRYEKRTPYTFWYESPQGPYEAMLEIAESGFVRSYPSLWAMEE
ncbi:putative glycolipid-binding domain-containing protein [Longimicrobium sp.]|uniref:putative glycolipid-binding domain-containing protein n=1 Tax=Longimicrobium sp. TaxID=2029185 RepID=UPI003B3BBDF1